MFKKALIGFVAVGIVFGFVKMSDAQYSRYNYLGPSEYHRIGISADDSANPTDTDDAFSCAGYSHVRVYCDITGSTSFNVTPLFWRQSSDSGNTADMYFPGTATTVSADTVYVLAVDQEPYLYMKCDGMVGAPKLTISLQGVGRL